jgi:hypothetical protein
MGPAPLFSKEQKDERTILFTLGKLAGDNDPSTGSGQNTNDNMIIVLYSMFFKK